MVIIYILLAILLFGLLVAVHEFGHFITAKLSGVRVNEFAIGMGPAIFKKQFGETVYALRILPIGGFCAMEGEDAESDDPRAFGNKSVWKRIVIVLAGSVMNLLAGFLVLSIVFAPIKRWYTPVVEKTSIETTENKNVLKAGDIIKSVDGYKVHIYSDIGVGITRGAEDGKVDIEVIRDGKTVMLVGIAFSEASSESQVKENVEKGGYTVDFVVEETSFTGKIKYIVQNGYNLVRLVVVGLKDLVSGNVSTKDMSGPVGIGKMMAETAKVDMSSLWYLLAFISINLGIMNLLPIPALDGGRFLFLLIELLRGKPVPPKYEGFVHIAGLVLLMLLMLFVTFNDIVKLFIK